MTDDDMATQRIDDLLDQVAALRATLADRDRLIRQLKDQAADLRGMLAIGRGTP